MTIPDMDGLFVVVPQDSIEPELAHEAMLSIEPVTLAWVEFDAVCWSPQDGNPWAFQCERLVHHEGPHAARINARKLRLWDDCACTSARCSHTPDSSRTRRGLRVEG